MTDKKLSNEEIMAFGKGIMACIDGLEAADMTYCSKTVIHPISKRKYVIMFRRKDSCERD